VDTAETLAEEHLRYRFPGDGRVIHEPDGGTSPDFLVDGRIAVEVRRLNEHDDEGIPRPLIETQIPLQNRLRNLANELDPDNAKTLVVYAELQRPLPSAKAVRSQSRAFFEELLASDEPEGIQLVSIPNMRLKCVGEASTLAGKPFLFVWVDLDSGGSILPLVRRNLEICVREKSRKTAPLRHKYPEWWLVLLDYVSWGQDDYAGPDMRRFLTLEHDWDRVVLVDPVHRECWFEL
jgi:hypothetical protein